MKFINASEATKISEEAFVVSDVLKKKVHDVIVEAANQGKRSVLLKGIAALFNGSFEGESLVQTKEQKSVIHLLREHGFSARYVEDGGAYVPKACQIDDKGNGPLFTNCYIEVIW